MPAYSYKERFVPMVIDGSKPHTIRSRRKNAAKPGDTLYHYFGMRTKWCKKLAEDKCKEVKTIYIDKKCHIYLLNGRLSDRSASLLKKKPKLITQPWQLDFNKTEWFSALTHDEASRLAWLDGFRPDGSTRDDPAGSLELMKRFWQQTHDLPFLGDIIYRNI